MWSYTYTCNSTTAVINHYTDAACTTPAPSYTLDYHDVGVCADSWKSTCRDETYVVVAEYNDSACTTKQRDLKVFFECTAWGNATTPASKKLSVGNVFTELTYSSSDCTGDATETTTLGSCGNCTDMGWYYAMWECASTSTRTSTSTSSTSTSTCAGCQSLASPTSPMKLHLLTGMIGFVFLSLNFWEPRLNIWAVTKTLAIRCIYWDCTWKRSL